MPHKPTGEQIVKKVMALKNDRSNWESYWQEIADNYMPRKGYIIRSRTEGERLDFTRIYDSTPVRALNTMASGFHSWLTNPAAKWFQLVLNDKRLMDNRAVKGWLSEVEDEINLTLNNSNWDETIQEFYIDAGGFGTGFVMTEEDIQERVRFTALNISEMLIVEDARGRVTEVYRLFEYTAQQGVERFGSKAGKEANDAVAAEKFSKKIQYLHAIFTRDVREIGKKDGINMPVASVWIVVKTKDIISEGGFREFPVAVGRFNKRTAEPWGFSPAMDSLADARMLQAQSRIIIRAAQKRVDPPVAVPSTGFMLPLNFNASGINYFNKQVTGQDLVFMQTGGNISIGREEIEQTRESINMGMFVRLFQAFGPITKQMTVPEVNARIREGMALLGPVVGRFQQEVLDVSIIRVFNILFRNGQLPLIPEILLGADVSVRYISPLAKAQRETEVTSILRTLQTVGDISPIMPQVIDKINPDKTVDIIADAMGAPVEMIRDDDEVVAIREARAQAEQAAALQATLANAGGIAKDVTQASKNQAEAVAK
jgi:hypothetical protein